MNSRSLLLVLAAALIHAVWNLILKKAEGKLTFLWLVSVVSAAIYLPFVIREIQFDKTQLTMSLCIFTSGSAVLHFFYFYFLQIGYGKSDLSIVYPMARGTGPLLSSIGAVLIFNERPGWMVILGIILIASGIFVMSGFELKKAGHARIKDGILYGTITGFFIAVYTLWDKAAVADFGISALLLTFASMVLPIPVLLPKAIREKEELKSDISLRWRHILAIAVLSPLSFILVLIALKTTPVSYVAPTRELSIVFGVFLGANILQESDAQKRVIASVMMLIGISLLALG
jgi:drug/metabolite transporter (DMT)-like permease